MVGGRDVNEGRIEIFYNNTWGTICDDIWDTRDAIVACRKLGYLQVVRVALRAEFGEGTGEIWLDNVECDGDESDLTECLHNGWGSHNCAHREDAGIVCTS